MKFSRQLKAALLAIFALASTASNLPAQAGSTRTNLANPQEGYLAAWRFVRDTYVDRSFAGQDWSTWEHKFSVHNAEDEFQAIKIMMESLHDPYTRPVHLIDKANQINALVPSLQDSEHTVSCTMLEHKIGYIKIASFASAQCADEVKANLKEFSRAQAMILDLRGNQGGLVINALEIADMFLNSGDIISTVSQDGKQTYSASGAPLSNQPLVLLVDEQTASAAEILASALKDNQRAKIVGKRTFGKGIVQELAYLPGVMLRCTASRYLTPNGTDINNVGLPPDIECSNDQDAIQLAIDYLEKDGRYAMPTLLQGAEMPHLQAKLT